MLMLHIMMYLGKKPLEIMMMRMTHKWQLHAESHSWRTKKNKSIVIVHLLDNPTMKQGGHLVCQVRARALRGPRPCVEHLAPINEMMM